MKKLSFLTFWLIIAFFFASTAGAQQGAVRVAVLRSTAGQAGELAEKVDASLLRNLADLAGINNPTVSPIDYAEIRLTVGCQDESRNCLASIAQMVQVDAVLVRSLEARSEGAVTLSLTYYDATSADEPTRVEITGQGAEAEKTVLDKVPSLVRGLFGIPETVAAAPPEAQPREQPAAPAGGAAQSRPAQESPAGPSRAGGVGALTWVALIAGAAVMTTGLVVGLSADDQYDAYKQTRITTEDDVKIAKDKLDKAQSRGTLANILIPTGGALLVAGGVLLTLDLLSGGKESTGRAARIYLAPAATGGLLVLDGSWKGSW